MTDGATIVRLSEWKTPSRAACTHSALPVSISTTARLAVTTASGSKVALSRRTRDPVGGAQPDGAMACSGSAGSGCRSGIDHLRHSEGTISRTGYASVILRRTVVSEGIKGVRDVVDEVVGVFATRREADEAGRDGVAPTLAAGGRVAADCAACWPRPGG